MIKLDPTVRVLDLDGSVTAQDRLLSVYAGRYSIQDLRRLGPSLRYLCGKSAVRELERTLRQEERGRLTFIGSGDFHHVTASLLRQFPDPLTLIVFDRHSDWDWRSPWPCCGSWIADALKLPQVSRIVMIGLGKEDIGGWRLLLGQPNALRSGRIQFYPFDAEQSRDLRGPISWTRVKNSRWEELADRIVGEVPTRNTYVSIDKDCLAAHEARTNWEPGGMTLDQIAVLIVRLAESHDIIGADITGEYSPIDVRNPIFRAIARADHPAQLPLTQADRARNEAANLRLSSLLLP